MQYKLVPAITLVITAINSHSLTLTSPSSLCFFLSSSLFLEANYKKKLQPVTTEKLQSTKSSVLKTFPVENSYTVKYRH